MTTTTRTERAQKINDAVGRELAAVRSRSRLTMDEVCALTGVSKSAYIDYEKGRVGVQVDKLDLLLTAMGANLPAFVASLENENDKLFPGRPRARLTHLDDDEPGPGPPHKD